MRRSALLLPLLLLPLLGACATSRPHSGDVERGVASWYGPGFHGNATASGQRYDMWAMTAAHRTLPLGSVIVVRNLDNDRSVRVLVNDRGPFAKNRIVDLSRAAAEALGMVGPGTAPVELTVVGFEPLAEGPFTVQVAAFAEPARAEELAATLRATHPAATVARDGVWNRVQIGSYKRREEADRLAGELRRAGYSAFVVAIAKRDGES